MSMYLWTAVMGAIAALGYDFEDFEKIRRLRSRKRDAIAIKMIIAGLGVEMCQCRAGQIADYLAMDRTSVVYLIKQHNKRLEILSNGLLVDQIYTDAYASAKKVCKDLIELERRKIVN